MAFALLKSQLVDVAFRLPLPLCPCTGTVDTHWQQHVLSSLGSPLGSAPCLLPPLRTESRPVPVASQIPQASLRQMPLHSASLLSVSNSCFQGIPFFSFIPSPSFTTAPNKKPITLPQPKKAFEKGGRHGSNVLNL